jgi:sporulation protein YlmC with PRC-barrel domain
MKKIAILMSAASLSVALHAGSAIAQGAPQSITAKRTDTVQLGSGYRASKLTGANVYDRDKTKIGTIDDLVLSPGEQGAFAILSVGGFLGMGKHLVAVPFNQLQVTNKQLVLPEATADSLKALPEFKYAPD